MLKSKLVPVGLVCALALQYGLPAKAARVSFESDVSIPQSAVIMDVTSSKVSTKTATSKGLPAGLVAFGWKHLIHFGNAYQPVDFAAGRAMTVESPSRVPSGALDGINNSVKLWGMYGVTTSSGNQSTPCSCNQGSLVENTFASTYFTGQTVGVAWVNFPASSASWVNAGSLAAYTFATGVSATINLATRIVGNPNGVISNPVYLAIHLLATDLANGFTQPADTCVQNYDPAMNTMKPYGCTTANARLLKLHAALD